MPIKSRYLFTAAMDVEPDKDAIFNEVYDKEHVPSLLEVPGVIAVARFKRRELEMFIGGERKKIVIEGEPTYTALYELAGVEPADNAGRGKPSCCTGDGLLTAPALGDLVEEIAVRARRLRRTRS